MGFSILKVLEREIQAIKVTNFQVYPFPISASRGYQQYYLHFQSPSKLYSLEGSDPLCQVKSFPFQLYLPHSNSFPLIRERDQGGGGRGGGKRPALVPKPPETSSESPSFLIPKKEQASLTRMVYTATSVFESIPRGEGNPPSFLQHLISSFCCCFPHTHILGFVLSYI